MPIIDVACEPKDAEEADIETTKSNDNTDLKLNNGADPKTKDAMNDDIDLTGSDGDLQIIETGDSSDVLKALQMLDPRSVRATIEFISDDDDVPNSAGEETTQIQVTNKTETEKVERPEEKSNKPQIGELIEERTDPSSEKESCDKADSNCSNAKESHTSVSQKAAGVKSESSDSDDDVLVVDECREDENDDLEHADRITAAIEKEMFKETSNDSSSKEEVNSIGDTSIVKSSNVDSKSKASSSNENPILSYLLKVENDDVLKTYKAIKRKNVSKSSPTENVGKGDLNQQQSKIVSADEEENYFEGGIGKCIHNITAVFPNIEGKAHETLRSRFGATFSNLG